MRKLLAYISVFVCCLLVSNETIWAQKKKLSSGSSALYNALYGNDARLVNGTQYVYPYHQYGNHPFFLTKSFTPSSIEINSAVFSGVDLKFDIFNNQLILQYITPVGALSQIQLVDSLVNGFVMSGLSFKKEIIKGEKKFVQQVNTGDRVCYFYWFKEKKVTAGTGNSYYSFTDVKRELYFKHHKKLVHINSKRDFLKVFKPEQQKQIKALLKKHRIRLRRKKTGPMQDFMNELNQTFKTQE